MRNLFFKVNSDQVIVAKKIVNCKQVYIILVDYETDGLKFSHSFKSNFSKKNTIQYLKSFFSKIEEI